MPTTLVLGLVTTFVRLLWRKARDFSVSSRLALLFQAEQEEEKLSPLLKGPTNPGRTCTLCK